MNPDDGRVVSNFIVQSLRGERITIYGDGQQTRSFCYVSDLVDGLIRLMESADDLTGPVNLGNPAEFTMLELAEKVQQLTGMSGGFSFEPLPQDDPKQRQPDITYAKDNLHWMPDVALEQGLRHTVAYFRGVLEKSPQA